jgi:putative transposase
MVMRSFGLEWSVFKHSPIGEVVPDHVELGVVVSRLRPALRWVLGVRQDTFKKGTTVSKKYQTIDAAVQQMSVPERVSVAMSEFAVDVSEGLLALAVGAGLQVLTAMMAQDVTALCGPAGRHNPDRVGYRHGTEAGWVPLGGRRVPVARPRVRAVDGSGELAVPNYEALGSTEILGRLAMSKMLAGLSTRRYPLQLEPVGAAVEATASGTSRSAVSRRFVARTETVLTDLMGADQTGLDLVAVMVDGVHFA